MTQNNRIPSYHYSSSFIASIYTCVLAKSALWVFHSLKFEIKLNSERLTFRRQIKEWNVFKAVYFQRTDTDAMFSPGYLNLVAGGDSSSLSQRQADLFTSNPF